MAGRVPNGKATIVLYLVEKFSQAGRLDYIRNGSGVGLEPITFGLWNSN